jgi:parallel beta-helix repeat protein
MTNHRRVRRPSLNSRFESLEGRLLLSGTFTVTDPGDASTGQTLRAAILAADSQGGPTTIDFDLPGPGPYQIQPTTPMPSITSSVTIDGTSQPGYAGTPVVMIDGTKLLETNPGLSLQSAGLVIKGLEIGHFFGNGIFILGSGGDQIISCVIGLSQDGKSTAPNGMSGIEILAGSPSTIGGSTSGMGNTISGNSGDGIYVFGPTPGNLIEGNTIGRYPSGTLGAGNGMDGIHIIQGSAKIIGNTVDASKGQAGILIADSSGSLIQGNLVGNDTGGSGNANVGIYLNGASRTTIGGTTRAEVNIVSGNGANGIHITNDSVNPLIPSANNLVEGNWLGLDPSGEGGGGNQGDGIQIVSSTGTTVGGTVAGSANVIGSNTWNGINVYGSPTTGTVIEGNIFGLATNGKDPAPNGVEKNNSGVSLWGSIGTLVLNNVVSESGDIGIFVKGGFGSIIQGNLIGTDISGTLARGNIHGGIVLESASLTLIGGATPATRNIIAANTDEGIYIDNVDNPNGFGNVVAGNFIGLDMTGQTALPNDQGIVVDHVPQTTIGGGPGAGNFISGNNTNGILVYGNSSTGTVLQGNIIGLAADATTVVPNMDGIVVSSAPGVLIEQNFISGNLVTGIYVVGAPTAGTVIIQNHIGTDGTGTLARGNGNEGVQIDGAVGVTVGGTSANDRNIISANGVLGVEVEGSTATGNVIEGNWIGLDTNGLKPLGNKVYGVWLQSPAVLVGGITPAARNVISGNGSYGVSLVAGATGDAIAGNWIGLDATGLKAVGNGVAGVFINNSAYNNLGGPSSAWANVISGNGSAEVQIEYPTAVGNFVEGNDLGTDATLYNVANPAPYGIYVYNAPGNQIGGGTAGSGNFIVGHKLSGIDISDPNSFFNLIIGNVIGPGEFLNSPEANGIGILINNAGDNTVGGTTPGHANVLRGNLYNPVYVVGVNAKGNKTGGNIVG